VIAISRFRVAPAQWAQFRADAEVAVAQFGASAGCQGAELLQNLDDPQLWSIVSRWEQVGSYRRAFNGTAAKMALIPLLSLAIDEPGAYTGPDEVGDNIPRVG
jgi:quinol monooxygenase YgiN